MCRTHSRSAHLFHFCPLLLPLTLSSSCFHFYCSQFSHYCSFTSLVVSNALFLPFYFKFVIIPSPLRLHSSQSMPKCHHSSSIITRSPKLSPNSQQICQTRFQLDTNHSQSSQFQPNVRETRPNRMWDVITRLVLPQTCFNSSHSIPTHLKRLPMPQHVSNSSQFMPALPPHPHHE